MNLLQMNLVGSVLIIVIALVRALGIHRLPTRLFCLLWLMVVSRLLVPFWAEIPILQAQAPREIAFMAPATRPAPPLITAPIQSAPLPEEPLQAPRIPPMSEHLHGILWLCGALLTGGALLISHLAARKLYAQAIPAEDQRVRNWLSLRRTLRPLRVLTSDRISSPLTYGVLRPIILLPRRAINASTEDLHMMLNHEYAHVRRLDALTKLLTALALCVHWFNPLIWVMVILSGRDIERACDEAVLRSLPTQSRRRYALMLLGMAQARTGFSLTNHLGKNAIEERILSMMKHKKNTLACLILSAALALGATAAFAQAVEASPSEVPSASPSEAALYAQDEVPDLAFLQESEPASDVRVNAEAARGAYSIREGTGDERVTDVTWWTADTFAQWADEQVARIQSLVGTQSSRYDDELSEWKLWTQADVDDYRAKCDAMLENLRAGAQMGYTVDGDKMILFEEIPATGTARAEIRVASVGPIAHYVLKEIPADGAALEGNVDPVRDADYDYEFMPDSASANIDIVSDGYIVRYSGPSATAAPEDNAMLRHYDVSLSGFSVIVPPGATLTFTGTKAEAQQKIRNYCEEQVGAGLMSREEAQEVYNQF